MVHFRSPLRDAIALDPWQPPADTVGRLFGGRYRIISRIGEGTTGAVFRADDTRGRASVAVKLLRPEIAAAAGLVPALEARIADKQAIEARMPGALDGMIDATALGTAADGQVFMAMPLVAGESLAAVVRRDGRMPWSRVQGIASQLCARLAAYHRVGLVHGALQLRACYLSHTSGHSERLEVLATGLEGQLIAAADELLRDAVAPTLAAYAAPEQGSGEPCDHRVDVYALGVCLFELLTGERPFEDPNPNRLVAMHLLAPAPSARARVPGAGIPAAVDAAILRAMAKRPEDRFASATAFADALAAADAPALAASTLVIPRLVAGAAAAAEATSEPAANEATASEPAPASAADAPVREPVASASGSRRRQVSGPHASASGSMRAKVIDLHPSASGSMRGRFDDPSASASMRVSASASGSRRVVTLIDIRAGESTSEGRVSSESTTEGTVRGHAGEKTMQRAVHAALRGAGVDGEVDGEDDLEDGDAVDLTSSSESLPGLRRDTLASTIEAPRSDDDTLAASGIMTRPSRGIVSWALGGIGALVAGSLAVALLSPAAESAPTPAPSGRSGAPTPAPRVTPTIGPVVSAAVVDGEAATVAEVEAVEVEAVEAEAEAEAAPAPVARAGASRRSTTKGTKSRARSQAKAAAEPEEDDVLTEVAAYMRRKKELEAKKQAVSQAGQGPSQGATASESEPPAKDVAAALDFLEQARKAYRRGEFAAAYTLATQSYGLRKGADAHEVMGLASCGRGDAERARWVHRQIAVSRRAAIEARCREAGITLD